MRLAFFVAISMPYLAGLCLTGIGLSGCEADQVDHITRIDSNLNPDERRDRAAIIRDAAAARGLYNGWLLAGVADAETKLSHCWSELTWACKGPVSADCGGGPVVAGAGDGPCEDKQGGLGMFQFDAGTHDETLAREGERILSISGNVDAAMDFVLSMLRRSKYIDLQSDADALIWLNELDTSGANFDAWIKTVTHYYNGCRPGICSKYNERFARYKAHTVDIHDEMGLLFWNTGVTPPPPTGTKAEFVRSTFPVENLGGFYMQGGTKLTGTVFMRNLSDKTWTPGSTFLYVFADGSSSPLYSSTWEDGFRATRVDQDTPPADIGFFTFTIETPTNGGSYPFFFTVEHDGTLYSNEDGPLEGEAGFTVSVDADEDLFCEDVGDRWTCNGDRRVVCEDEVIIFERCENGCIANDDADDYCDGDNSGKGDGLDVTVDVGDGCAAAGTSNGVSLVFFIGLALFLRRRRTR